MGVAILRTQLAQQLRPPPQLSPHKGGREQTESAARVDSISTRHALKTRCCAAAQEKTNTAFCIDLGEEPPGRESQTPILGLALLPRMRAH